MNANDHPYKVTAVDSGEMTANDHPYKVIIEGGTVTPEEFEELSAKVDALATDLSYKGSVETYEDLPSTAEDGDTYLVSSTGVLYTWADDKFIALNETSSGPTEVTTADYNWPTNNPTSVAWWKLPSGLYRIAESSVTLTYHYGGSTIAPGIGATFLVFHAGEYNRFSTLVQNFSGAQGRLSVTRVDSDMGFIQGNTTGFMTLDMVINTLTSSSAVYPLSANQGKILNDKIGGDLSNLDTTDKSSLINAINELVGGSGGGVIELTEEDYNWPTNNPNGIATWLLPESGIYKLTTSGLGTIYVNSGSSGGSSAASPRTFIVLKQGTGESAQTTTIRYGATRPEIWLTTDSTGQRTFDGVLATFGDIYYNSDANKIAIGSMAGNQSDRSIRIGHSVQSDTSSNYAIAMGLTAGVTQSNRAIAIGASAQAYAANFGVAIGAGAQATQKGQFDISTTREGNTYGYNNSPYRLLTGLYNPQSDHDAANKQYVDGAVIRNAGAPDSTTVGTVGQLLEDTTNGKLYICTDATNPYVWSEVGSGGGGGSEIHDNTLFL